MPKKQLIIITGIGDGTTFFSAVKPLWSLLGYDLHVFAFGWSNSNDEYRKAFNRFKKYVNKFPNGVYIIGVSAGGTAAINALAECPDYVKSVVVISSPLTDKLTTNNKLLLASTKELMVNLNKFDDSTMKRITLFHGLVDNVVPARIGRYKGIRSIQLFTIGHVMTILIALTICSRSIKNVLVVTSRRI